MVFNLAIALLLLLALFGVKKIRNSLRKKATGSRGRVPRKAGTGLRLLTLAEYEANMRKTTEREKQKLYRSAEYKKQSVRVATSVFCDAKFVPPSILIRLL